MTALQQAVDGDFASEIVREEEGEAMPDRRERDRREPAWSDPRLWVSVAAVLLTIMLAILGYIATQLSSIAALAQSTRDAVIIVTTRQERDGAALAERVTKLENAMETQKVAHNFNITTRLAKVEAALEIKSSKKED